jgi:hypothetical protein
MLQISKFSGKLSKSQGKGILSSLSKKDRLIKSQINEIIVPVVPRKGRFDLIKSNVAIKPNVIKAVPKNKSLIKKFGLVKKSVKKSNISSGKENERFVDDLKDIFGTVSDTVETVHDTINDTEIKTNNTIQLDKGTKTFIGVVVAAIIGFVAYVSFKKKK